MVGFFILRTTIFFRFPLSPRVTTGAKRDTYIRHVDKGQIIDFKGKKLNIFVVFIKYGYFLSKLLQSATYLKTA